MRFLLLLKEWFLRAKVLRMDWRQNENSKQDKKDTRIIAKSVRKINLLPNFHAPKIMIGILISKNSVPVSSGITLFKMIDSPDIPPGAKSFGSMKRLIPAP